MIRLKELDHFGVEVSDLERAHASTVIFSGWRSCRASGPMGLCFAAENGTSRST